MIGPVPGEERMDPEKQLPPTHEFRNALTVVTGRTQVLRRRLRRRAVDLARLDAELEAIEAAVVRLVAAADRLDREAGG
jgi:hypothetical protein